MNQRTYIDFLNKNEKLKCNTRHSWTSNGRQESVAEHSWRLAVMAMLCADEYQKKIKIIAAKEEPYDVFINLKKTTF